MRILIRQLYRSVVFLSVLCVLPFALATDILPELDCVIEPSEIVDIGSATAGVLEAMSFDRGDSVNKNQVVARLESGTEKAAAELARVRSTFDTGIILRRTSAEFFNRNQERSQSLTKQNAISRQQLDQLDTEAIVAELQVRQEEDNKQLAKLEYRRARQALGRRTIRSPIDGVVMERFRSVGEYVEDTAILRVAQLDPLYIETIVPVSHMGLIKTGMQAQVTPVVPGQNPEFATVTRIDKVADAASGTFGVRLEMANPNKDIVTGVRCTLEFTGKTLTAEKNKAAAPKSTKAPVASVSKGSNKFAKIASIGNDQNGLPQCFEAGPFTQRAVASKLIEKLLAVGGRATLREASGSHPDQYFVLTRKTKSKADGQQLLAELQQKGVTDTHALHRGVHGGSISLGLFNSQESAIKKVEQFSKVGIQAHVAERSPNTLWLDINAASMDSNSVRRLFAADVPARVNDVSCASLRSYVK